MRTHYKIKPFICTFCSKSFNEKGNLKTHVRIHTGERPFKCNKCEKSFKALGQLKDHFISHTGLKPFQCPFCKKFYRRKEILKNHFLKHKNDEFFLNNSGKYKEFLESINKMKNMNPNFDSINSKNVNKSVKEKKNNNVNNNINNTGTGNETNLSNLSSSVSFNDDNKQSFCNNKNVKNINISNDNNEITKKNIDFNISVFNEEVKEKNNVKENNEIKYFEKINNDKNIYNNFFDNKIMNFPEISFLPNEFIFNSNEEDNNIYLEENESIESNGISFQKVKDIAEKEIGISNNLKDNNFFSLEKTEKDFENCDCYSKITNLYFQTYQHKLNINI